MGFFPFKSLFAAIFANSFSIFKSSFLSAVVFLSSHFIYLIRAQAFVRLSLSFQRISFQFTLGSTSVITFHIQMVQRMVEFVSAFGRFWFRSFPSLLSLCAFCIVHNVLFHTDPARPNPPPPIKKNSSFVFEVHLMRSAAPCSFYHFF